MVQRFNGSMAQRLNGSTVQQLNGSMVQWFNGSMAQRFNGSTAQNLLHPFLSIVAHSLLRYHHRCSVKDAVIWIVSSADVSDEMFAVSDSIR